MLSFGSLIWTSCKPLIRLSACVISGVIATKANIFPLLATKSLSQILINIVYPCFLFSKIVPASLTTNNIGALGPLIVVALLYELLGGALGLIIKQFFWVPHRFRYGIIIAGAFGNVGDLPTTVALTATTSAPFNGTADQNLSIAYISVFILVFVLTLFPMGSHKLIMWDFEGPAVEPEEVIEATRHKRQAILKFFRLRRLGLSKARDGMTSTLDSGETKPTTDSDGERNGDDSSESVVEKSSQLGRISVDQNQTDTDMLDTLEKSSIDLEAQDAIPSLQSTLIPRKQRASTMLEKLSNFLKNVFSPISLSILIAFLITLVPKLKALFVSLPDIAMPTAPDGLPPLSFILDVTSLIGNASVPFGLMCLGSSLARLKIPKRGEWKKLPLGAIISLAVGKLLVMPIVGVMICQGLTSAGFISEHDKVLRFICIFCSCLPTATSQVFLTQAYSESGSAEDISVFLLPQYFLMFITMTTITAYTIHLLSLSFTFLT